MRGKPNEKATVNLLHCPAIVTDNCRDVISLRSTRYGSFSMAGDSLKT